MTRVAITGANGFIGRNLVAHLAERSDVPTVAVPHQTAAEDLATLLGDADLVIHLAGVNRPESEDGFGSGNAGFTDTLCHALAASSRAVPVAFASSIQADRDNAYGRSKRAAEDRLRAYGEASGAPVHILRLPNVFGKWSRPDYNSAVATFCHNIARGLPIRIDDARAALSLVYIDDVVAALTALVDAPHTPPADPPVQPVYVTTVGAVAEQIGAFRDSRESLVSEPVGQGLTRALYSTYLSFLPTDAFSYDIPGYGDARGMFAEVLKTRDSGQFSFFTAGPGVTRGGHYHHSKTEKFLVLKGAARYRFRHLITGEEVAIDTRPGELRIVETIPGWAHDITNTGEEEMIVMLWANEIFDRSKPDTYAHAL